jgi:hypothetical protein
MGAAPHIEEGPDTAVGRRWTTDGHVPAQTGKGGADGWAPAIVLGTRRPLTCRPRPQCRGLNSPNGQVVKFI